MENISVEDILKTAKKRKKVSISYIQNTFSVGFGRAFNLFKELVDKGYIEKDGTIIRPGIKILFLDVDGVLNCHSTVDKCGPYRGIEDKKVNLLKEIVESTKAKIVLVSTWKEYWYKSAKNKDKQDDLAVYLDVKLYQQGLVMSDKTNNYSLDRGEGILEYLDHLNERGIKVDKYIIIDDEMFDYKKTGLTKHLVQTNFDKDGLEEKHVKKAVKMLA